VKVKRVDCELRSHGDVVDWEVPFLYEGELDKVRRYFI